METTVDCAVFLTPVADDDEASVLEREREGVWVGESVDSYFWME